MPTPKGYNKVIIDAEKLTLIGKMAAAGLNNDQMSAILGVSTSTFDDRMAERPDIKQAVAEGRAKAIFNVAVSAYAQAISGKVPAMTMFYLKCRAGWKETQVTEIAGKDGENVFQSFTDMIKKVPSE